MLKGRSNHFNMTDLWDYHNFYLLTDVLLLMDIFENFRDVCLQYYGLDPAHNTLPLVCLGKLLLKWQIWNWIFLLIEVIKGGVRMISHKYAQPNAPGMENYDASKRNSYIMYLDANNLYGWAMSQPLPKSNFKWLTDEEVEELDMKMILMIVQGYIF